jgi:hypothetical protein
LIHRSTQVQVYSSKRGTPCKREGRYYKTAIRQEQILSGSFHLAHEMELDKSSSLCCLSDQEVRSFVRDTRRVASSLARWWIRRRTCPRRRRSWPARAVDGVKVTLSKSNGDDEGLFAPIPFHHPVEKPSGLIPGVKFESERMISVHAV